MFQTETRETFSAVKIMAIFVIRWKFSTRMATAFTNLCNGIRLSDIFWMIAVLARPNRERFLNMTKNHELSACKNIQQDFVKEYFLETEKWISESFAKLETVAY